MFLNCKILVMMTAVMISASATGPIIELPPDYDHASPWKQLAVLGLANLTETDCQRTCVTGEAPRVCLYTFILENYAAMGTACGNCSHGILKDCFRSQCIPADGYERGVMSINRMIPGPEIHICKYDVLVVNVKNNMPGTGATIHWHGISQEHNQWMDGVPYVTQCPIGTNTFTYIFEAQETGSYFYHSHTGFHRTNGQYGTLIVREPRSQEAWPSDIYNQDLPEHAIMISDWMHYTAEMFFPGLPTLQPGITPSTLLINGLGRYSNESENNKPFKLLHPLATFHVERNQRYRFRIINGNSLICPVLVQIEDHNMTLIATDGNPIEPVVIDGFVSFAGERFDVVIDTNNVTLEKNSFWVHFRGLAPCEIDQYAVLSYGTNASHLGIIPQGRRPTMENPLPNNTILSYPATECGASPKRLCISDLRAIGYEKDESILTAEPDVRLFIPFDFHIYKNVDKFHRKGNYETFMNVADESIRSGTMNNITFEFPSTPSLSLRGTKDPGFCNVENLPARCKNDGDSIPQHCTCPHFVTLKENDIVEMTLVNADSEDIAVDHPIHLHGSAFYVVHMGLDIVKPESRTMDEVRQILLKQADASLNTSHFVPALKDTISVPVKGFVITRWRASNPGDWLLHCHFEWHSTVGMMMVLRVLGQIAEKPPGFPTCGNFDPLHLTDGTMCKLRKHIFFLNHPNLTCGVSGKRLCITDPKAIEERVDIDISTAQPDIQLLIPFGHHEFKNIDDFHREGNYQRFSNPAGHIINSAVINNLSFTFLTTPTLFVRDRDPGFCNPAKLPATCQNDGDNSTTPYCETIKDNDIVELTHIDSSSQSPGINHAMHLHGYGFYVMYVHGARSVQAEW